MGVDGVGKSGPPVAPPEAEPAAEIAPDGASGVASPEAPAGAERPAESLSTDALAQLERGDIDLDHYLDLRVEAATTHLDGRLSGEDLDTVRATLREQIENDPVLVELVRRVTGGLTPGETP